MQALTELVDKLNAAELEVEKAATMGIAAESKQMSEEEIVACKKVVEPAYTRKVQLCLRRQRSPPWRRPYVFLISVHLTFSN